jgi:YD repeat-containing protein
MPHSGTCDSNPPVKATGGFFLPAAINYNSSQGLEESVKVIYDNETDTLSIILRDGKVAESDEPRDGLILDYDKAGRLVSIELLDASEQVQLPQSIEFALAARK